MFFFASNTFFFVPTEWNVFFPIFIFDVNVFEDPYAKLNKLPDPETPPDATIVGLNGVVVDLKVPPYAKENILIFSTQWKSEN